MGLLARFPEAAIRLFYLTCLAIDSTSKMYDIKLIVFELLLLTHIVFANVEKTIFVSPYKVKNTIGPKQQLSGILSPSTPFLRTHLSVQFPTVDVPRGQVHWILLENLVPNTRYEVRICSAATVSATHIYNFEPVLVVANSMPTATF